MNIFITGATGFVGSHLDKLLTDNGHQVYDLYRSEKKLNIFPLKGNLIKGDLSEFSWIDKLPEQLDTVIHTAGIVHSQDPNLFDEINNIGTQKLISALSKKYQQLHFILISSLAAQGPNELGPVSEYGRSKLRAEHYLADQLPKNWKYTIIRPPMVIGPHDPAMLDIFKMVQDGWVFGHNTNKRYSFIGVFDLVHFIDTITRNRVEGIYTPAWPKPLYLTELIKLIQNQLGIKKVRMISIPGFVLKTAAQGLKFLHSVRPHDLRLTTDKIHEILPDEWICSSKSCEGLPFTFKDSPEKIVKLTVADYLSRRWLKSTQNRK